MQNLTDLEISQVAGGCAQYCWGDMSFGGFMASMVGGALGGAGGGPVGVSLGAIGGGAGYFFSKAWD